MFAWFRGEMLCQQNELLSNWHAVVQNITNQHYETEKCSEFIDDFTIELKKGFSWNCVEVTFHRMEEALTGSKHLRIKFVVEIKWQE